MLLNIIYEVNIEFSAIDSAVVVLAVDQLDWPTHDDLPCFPILVHVASYNSSWYE